MRPPSLYLVRAVPSAARFEGLNMKAINKAATALFEKMIDGLKVGESRKIDNAPGAYMAVEILRRSETVYTVGHYFEQNGDRVQDPEVDFYVKRVDVIGKGEIVLVIPTAIWHSIGVRQVVAEINPAGNKFHAREQRDLAAFVGTWFRNIKEQQF